MRPVLAPETLFGRVLDPKQGGWKIPVLPTALHLHLTLYLLFVANWNFALLRLERIHPCNQSAAKV